MKKSTIFSMKDCVAFLLYPILLLVLFCFIPVAMAAQAPIEGQQTQTLSKQWQKYTPELGLIVVMKTSDQYYGPYLQSDRITVAAANKTTAADFFVNQRNKFTSMGLEEQLFDSELVYNANPETSSVPLPNIYVVKGLSLSDALALKSENKQDKKLVFIPNWQAELIKDKKQSSTVHSLGSGDDVQNYIPNDRFYTYIQAIFEKMGCGKLFRLQLGNRRSSPVDTTVVTIDSGTSPQLADLKGSTFVNAAEIPGNGIDDDHNGYIDDFNGFNFLNQSGDVADTNVHGTGKHSDISATGDNGLDVVGINGMDDSVKVLALVASGANGLLDGSAIVKSFQYSIVNASRFNIRVINNSYSDSGDVRAIFLPIYQALDSLNVLVIYAAGNERPNLDAVSGTQQSLAREVNNVLVIAAVDKNDNFTSFSGYGPNTIYLAACSEAAELTPSGFVGGGNGTSISCAYVSGSAAAYFARNQSSTAYQAKMQLIMTSDKFENQSQYINFLGGRVNVYRAVTEHPIIPPKPVSAPVISFTEPSFRLVRVGKKQFQVKVDVVVKQNSSNLPVAINFDWLDNSPHTELFDTSATHTYSTKKGHSVIAYAFVVTQDGQVVKSLSVTCQVVFQK